MSDFAQSFDAADRVLVAEVLAPGEANPEGRSARPLEKMLSFVDRMSKRRDHTELKLSWAGSAAMLDRIPRSGRNSTIAVQQ